MPPTQRSLRFTARITVEIEEIGQLTQALRDSLTQAVRAAVPPPPASGPAPPSRPVRDPVQVRPVPASPDPGRENRLLETKQVAKILNVGERTLWRYWNSGRVLKPIKIGGAVRWSASELHRWIEAGCPSHEQWVKMSKE